LDSKRLNTWITVGANVAVLIGIVFLIIEIRQSNRIAMAATEISVRESFGSSNETVYTNPEFAALLAKARKADAAFTDAEQEMLDYWVARMMNIWMQIDRAYTHEMVVRESLDMAIEDMKWTIDTYPALRSNFEDWPNYYPSSNRTALMQELAQHLDGE